MVDEKYLIISNEAPPRGGGIGVLGVCLSEITSGSFIVSHYANILKSKGYRNLAKIWIFELSIRLLLQNYRGCLIVVNDFGGLVALYTASIFTLRKFQIKAAFIVHGSISETNTKGKRLRNRIVKFIVKKLNIRVIYVSNFIRKIHLELGYIDGPVIHIGSISMQPSRNDIITNQENFLILSRINEKKTPLEFFEFAKYFAEVKRAKLEVICAGAVDDPTYLEKISKSLLNSNVSIKYLGVISRKEVVEILAKPSILVNASSLREAAPTVAYEAAAVRKPYIYFGSDGSSEISVYNPAFTMQLKNYNPEEAQRLARYLSNDQKQVAYIEYPSVEKILKELRSVFNDHNHC